MTTFPTGTTDVDSLPEGPIRYSFCTLVTKPDQYADMIQSFRDRGFDAPDCEFLYADNTTGNGHDGFDGLNTLIHKAQGAFVVLLHQDILAIDDRAQLDKVLAELEAKDPAWAVAGNAGASAEGKVARRMTSYMGYNDRMGDLPVKVETLDEDLLILRRSANLAPSHDLKGFHLYGTDLVQQAAFRGWSTYVIDFHVEHMGHSDVDDAFVASLDAFRAKYRRALRPKLLSTAVTHVGFGREFLKSLRHRARIGHEARGTRPAFDLPSLRRRLSDAKYRKRDQSRGGRYELEGTTFQLPKHAPVAAMRALLTGRYEKPERDLARKYLPRDLPVIELGGAYGIVSNRIRTHLDDSTHLTVVEANPDLIEVCTGNVAKAGMDNTEVVHAALAYGADSVRFTVTEGHHTSHVSTEMRDDAGHEIEVPALTLAKLLEKQGIDGRYSLVCDIEGEEFDLFLNDTEALSRCAVAIVEFHPDPFVRRGTSTSAFLSHVRDAGFEIVETQANVLAAVRPDGGG